MKLQLELLEERTIPSSTPVGKAVTSYNWAGYAVVAAPYSVMEVHGSWKIPFAAGTGTAYSATWVGIDGATSTSQTVEQIGTSSEIHNGKPVYYAWVELFPAPPEKIPMKVLPGDLMRAQITADPEPTVVYDQPNGGGRLFYNVHHMGFYLTLKNMTRGWTYTKYAGRYNDDGPDPILATTAEWITEAPLLVYSDGRAEIARLPNFGTQSFFNCGLTVGVKTDPYWNKEKIPLPISGPINGRFMGGTTYVMPLTMLGWATNKPIAVASQLSANGTAFNVAFGSKTPPAPGATKVTVNEAVKPKPASKPQSKPAPSTTTRSLWNGFNLGVPPKKKTLY